MIEIADKVSCCGCSACANACPKMCISMKEDKEGFKYPVVDNTLCIDCNLCERVCPILNYKTRENNPKQSAAIVQHKNDEICSESTAGGAFTAIAEYVIDNGGVVFGVEMNSEYFVQHIKATTKAELTKFRNSKYVQSEIGDSFKQVESYLKKGKLVCFSGTPCQIEGLRFFLGKEYKNLILVDVVCRAVPSPGVWKKYINSIGDKVKSVRFRDKTLGYQYSTMEIVTEKGNVLRGGIESQPWLRMFFSGMIIRPSCSDCKFRSRYRNSDFTIWDCFNVHSFDKSFNEKKGVTRVLIHTPKAYEIFDSIKKNYKYKQISPEKIVEGVQQLKTSPTIPDKRDDFFIDYQKLSIDKLIDKYFPLTFKVKAIVFIRKLLNKFSLDILLKRILKKGK